MTKSTQHLQLASSAGIMLYSCYATTDVMHAIKLIREKCMVMQASFQDPPCTCVSTLLDMPCVLCMTETSSEDETMVVGAARPGAKQQR